jgi:hypothetical protein
MKIPRATATATIDHFKPKSTHQELAYEWSNFRLASQQVNTNKGDHEDVLDPFEIENGWFALDIGTFEIRPSPDLDDARRPGVERTISVLRLNEPTFRKAREEYHDRYHGLSDPVGGRPKEPLPLWWLREECPYVAQELQSQGRLREEDGAPPAPPEAHQ